ncbi:hypothetical protein SLUN_28575 [Streptomyces lunaelactis]|uniref:RNA polymerase sigma factor 70 region 4 type 2 domain-containing protein n=1 Tax=Streptomyces lunaelactis TaxID=1535768 RepID=A0A2R4T916_9ACTN|nr:sigma factor-like helix-turn-helix DNA-binding protein [Streptomyces lunaelactis]AVZ75574.1 hypothetical protein SLUN_28575 [Streptomyces lunaelactis]NUK87923.1 sigma-70 family RNA polymerase sigma factor [Streptomyces lunaelactis]
MRTNPSFRDVVYVAAYTRRTDLDDVARVLESLFGQWERVARMSNPLGYAVAAARNRAVDVLRRQREIPTDSELLIPLVEQQDHGTAVGDSDVLEDVLSAVKAMRGQMGRVLLMSLAGLGHGEIAERLGVTQSTVRLLLHRGWRQLMASDEVR